MTNYRHGDLSFHSLESKPEHIKRIEHGTEFILAYGEATGHRHLLTAPARDKIEIYQDGQGRYVLNVLAPADISHQEHKTITLQPGWYVQEHEREMDWFSQVVRRVTD